MPPAGFEVSFLHHKPDN
uniref:Uncharacterized protein n=1 Tax=Arundo donax TaxID=35708 RepID=A0A0A8YE00_ARUDO